MKKNNISLFSTIIFMIVIIAAASYSYFEAESKIGNDLPVNISLQTGEAVFTASVEKDTKLKVDIHDMSSENIGTSVFDNGTVIVELLSGNDNFSKTCTYDIDYVWDSQEYVPSEKLPLESGEKFELSLSGTRSIENDDEYKYNNIFLEETNIDRLNWISDNPKTAKLIDDVEIHNQSSFTSTKTVWTFTIKFYSLPLLQNNLLDKKYQGHLVISDINC